MRIRLRRVSYLVSFSIATRLQGVPQYLMNWGWGKHLPFSSCIVQRATLRPRILPNHPVSDTLTRHHIGVLAHLRSGIPWTAAPCATFRSAYQMTSDASPIREPKMCGSLTEGVRRNGCYDSEKFNVFVPTRKNGRRCQRIETLASLKGRCGRHVTFKRALAHERRC
jgi:hypothetical protein